MYSADVDFSASTGTDSSAPQVVTQDGTQTVVVTPDVFAVYGEAITLTALLRRRLPVLDLPLGR